MRKYVVIGGHGETFKQCIGVFDNANEALGEAIIYLNDVIDNCSDEIMEKLNISRMYALECGTGFGMDIIGHTDIDEYAEILFCDKE